MAASPTLRPDCVGAASSAVALACLLALAPAPGGAIPATEAPAKRAVRLDDVPAPLRACLPGKGRSAAAFERDVAALNRQTAERERDGEYDHLIFFLLQSRRFTNEPSIEPARSAHEFLEAMDADERRRYLSGEGSDDYGPRVMRAVGRRIVDFERALAKGPRDSRLAYFRELLEGDGASWPSLTERLVREYTRVMRFLYRKEFLSRNLQEPPALEAFLAGLYRERGHSTDTQVEANFGVHTALAVIRALREPGPLDHVLVVGPGLDFAPRTDLQDLFEPASYQPFAVADAMLSLGLSTPERLRVHCVDINPRVNAYLQGLSRERPTRLPLVAGVPERPERPFTADYREYFERLGRSVGEVRPLSLPAAFGPRLHKALVVRAEITRRITADRFDVVTERYDPPPRYDLVVVTNVFSYFDPAAQALAVSNLGSMLRPGGYLVHNEPQSSLVSAAQAVGLPVVQGRTVLLASGAAPLFDRVLIHQKASCDVKEVGGAPSLR